MVIKVSLIAQRSKKPIQLEKGIQRIILIYRSEYDTSSVLENSNICAEFAFVISFIQQIYVNCATPSYQFFLERNNTILLYIIKHVIKPLLIEYEVKK
jgi:hypothetical protein